jgi:hypothetical protein
MPPRRRPTARLLTPAGWLGLLTLTLVAGGLALIAALHSR